MNAAILIRTVSFPAPPNPHSVLGSPAAYQDSSVARENLLRRSRSAKISPIPALHLEMRPEPLRRARSDTDLMRSARTGLTAASASRWPPPARVAEVEDEEEEADIGFWRGTATADAAAAVEEPEVDVEYSGGDMGKGRKIGGGWSGGRDDNRRMRVYYQEMLKGDPVNPLLLKNYGRFLHEVEGDAKGAAEYYGRAILASPGDGEVLSLYGKLVWETQGDGDRASVYFERAVEASPNDCYVVASYAKFLWDTEEEEEEEEELGEGGLPASSPLVEVI